MTQEFVEFDEGHMPDEEIISFPRTVDRIPIDLAAGGHIEVSCGESSLSTSGPVRVDNAQVGYVLGVSLNDGTAYTASGKVESIIQEAHNQFSIFMSTGTVFTFKFDGEVAAEFALGLYEQRAGFTLAIRELTEQ